MVTRPAPTTTPQLTPRTIGAHEVLDLDAMRLLDAGLGSSQPGAALAEPMTATAPAPLVTRPASVLRDARTGEPWVLSPPSAPPVSQRPAPTADTRGWIVDLLLVAAALVVPVLLVVLAAAASDPRLGGTVLIVGLIGLSAVSSTIQRRRERPLHETERMRPQEPR